MAEHGCVVLIYTINLAMHLSRVMSTITGLDPIVCYPGTHEQLSNMAWQSMIVWLNFICLAAHYHKVLPIITTLHPIVHYPDTHDQESNMAEHGCVVLIYAILCGYAFITKCFQPCQHWTQLYTILVPMSSDQTWQSMVVWF